MTDIGRATNEQLLAELTKRLGAKPAARRGTTTTFRKSKREWAQDQLDEARKALERVDAESVPAGPQTARKAARLEVLRGNVTKYERLVKRYTETGE